MKRAAASIILPDREGAFWLSGAALLAILLSLLLSFTFVTNASAQNKSLKDAMFGRPGEDGRRQATPDTAQFMSEDGQGFIFDESRGMPLMRFDGEDEIWALSATPGPKGDIIYKNDVGEPMLKSTRWGGMILFTREKPGGVPAAVSGKAQAFKPPHMGPQALFQFLAKSSRRASASAGHLIRFGAEVDSPDADFLFAEAANNAAYAIAEVSATSQGRSQLSGLREVQIIEGRPPGARFDKGVLRIKVDVTRGNWRGRPSSRSIVRIFAAPTSVANR